MNLHIRGDDRGVAAGVAAVLLAVFVLLLLVRFEEKWGPGVHLILAGAAAAALIVLALRLLDDARPAAGTAATTERARLGARIGPAGWVSAMLVAAFALSVWALINLADILGGSKDEPASGTITWVALVLVLAFGALSARTGSAICTFLAAVSLVVGVEAAVDWIFSPEAATTFRWVLLILAVLLAAAGLAARDERPRHGTVLIAVAGLSILVLALSFTGDAIVFSGDGGESAGGNVGWGWELVIVLSGLGLAAYSILTREPGPGYIAAAVLGAFVLLAARSDDEPSIIGWPLVLLLLTLAAAAAAFRPGDGAGPGPAPAARHDDPGGPGEPVHETRL